MCILLILFSFGCAGRSLGNYGTIVPDRNVTHAFKNYQVNPDLNYYTSGSDVYPNAIIGIDKRYVLDSTLWKKVEFTPQTLKILVNDMNAKVSEINQTLHGFAILDTRGNTIGYWFSILSARTTVRIEDHSVFIFTPDLDTYDKYEREREESK
jgi:hypothetical protein